MQRYLVMVSWLRSEPLIQEADPPITKFDVDLEMADKMVPIKKLLQKWKMLYHFVAFVWCVFFVVVKKKFIVTFTDAKASFQKKTVHMCYLTFSSLYVFDFIASSRPFLHSELHKQMTISQVNSGAYLD